MFVLERVDCNYHLFLPWRMLHAEVTDSELSFAHKMSLQALGLYGHNLSINSKVKESFLLLTNVA